MFDMEVDNTLTLSNHQELIKELEKLLKLPTKTNRRTPGRTKQNNASNEMYSLAHTNYSFSKYQQTLYYKTSR
jgi:hypothetical protein